MMKLMIVSNVWKGPTHINEYGTGVGRGEGRPRR